MSPEEWDAQQSLPVVIGAPGSTETDRIEGTDTEESISLRSVMGDDKDNFGKDKPLSPEEWAKSQEPPVETPSPTSWEATQPKQEAKPPLWQEAVVGAFEAKKAVKNLTIDAADFIASIPAFLAATGAGLLAAETHSVIPGEEGTHFGAGSAVAGEIMDKFGNPIRKALEGVGALEKPTESTSVITSAMEVFAETTHEIAKTIGEETGSEEVADASEFFMNYLALPAGAKATHSSISAIKKSKFKPPVPDSAPADLHVELWKKASEQESKLPNEQRPVTLDDTTPPKYLYHGTRKSTGILIDSDGNLVLNPSKNYGGKTESVSLTHNIDYANDYASRVKGGGPDGFDFEGSKVIKIESDALPEKISRESGEEWAYNTSEPIVVPKGKFIVEEHPLSKRMGEDPNYTYNDWVNDNFRGLEKEGSDGPLENKEGHFQNYLDDLHENHDYAIEYGNKASEIQKLKDVVEQRSSGKYQEPTVEWNKPTEKTPDNLDPLKVTDMEDFIDKGRHIYKTQGEAAAQHFAKQTIIERRNRDLGTPKTEPELADTFYKLNKNGEADKVETTKKLTEADKADGVSLEMKERFREHGEGLRELDQAEQTLFNKYYASELTELHTLNKLAQERGWELPTELSSDIGGSYFPRHTYTERPSMVKEWKRKFFEGHQGGLDLGISRIPAAGKERGLFVVEFPSGQRLVVQNKGKDTIAWSRKQASKLSIAEKGTELKTGLKIGKGVVKEATVGELEKHTNYRYNKDSQAVLYKRLNEMRTFIRSKQLVENLKDSPMFEEFAYKIPDAGKVEVPEGYIRPAHVDRLPEFSGYAFKPEIAHIIEDFARYYHPNALTLTSAALIKNMMLNPIPHMFNEVWHLYNARGMTGWVTPAGIGRFIKTAKPAMDEVLTQGPQYRSMLRDGASLLSADTRSNPIQNAFMEKGIKEFVDGPEGRSLARQVAMSPVELYTAVSRQSSKAMWVTRDIMYMQLINEKVMKGMTQKEAIVEVERHMPAYKIPPKVLKSRSLSRLLQNPSITVFSRYHYGMLKSLGETALDLSGKNGKAKFLEGADQAVAIAVALSVLYPMQDMLAQALTGNKDATVRRAGPYHPMHAIAEIAHGEKEPQAFIASMFTFNPALLMGAQLIGDRKLYNGQPIYSPSDDAKFIAKDVGNYLFTQVPQFSTIQQASNEEYGGGVAQWIGRQVDIKVPSKEKVRRMKMIQQRTRSAARNRAFREKHKR